MQLNPLCQPLGRQALSLKFPKHIVKHGTHAVVAAAAAIGWRPVSCEHS
jgi:hypothetical protein